VVCRWASHRPRLRSEVEPPPALAGLQRALQVTRRVKDETTGPLRIVGPRSTFTPVLWPLLDEFCRLYPKVQPDVELHARPARRLSPAT